MDLWRALRRNRLALTGAVFVAIVSASALFAQERIEVRPGHRVRVTLASRVAPAPMTGCVTEIRSDTLVVERQEGGERRLGRSQVDRVEVGVGTRRSPAEGAKYGVVTAAPLLIPLAVLAPLLMSEGGGYGALLVVGLPIAGAAILGAAIGGGAQEVWVEAQWPMAPDPNSFLSAELAACNPVPRMGEP